MAIKVGEKIKSLRKSLNMTQSELAGTEMTKSMLSQIENNVSNPSMRTLNYIANKLKKPVSYFLEEDTDKTIENKISNQEQEDKIKHINELIDSNKIDESKEFIDKLINDSNINKSLKCYGDILLKFGNVQIKYNNLDAAKHYINFALSSYIEGNFYSDAAKAYIQLAKCSYEEFNYTECLSICEKAFELYYKNINTDPLLEIELYYFKILMLSAIGDIQSTIKTINTAISISAKTSIYYRTDELYRLNAIFNYFIGNLTEYNRSIEKALQFAKFSEDNMCLSKVHTIFAIYALESNDAEKALENAEISKDYTIKALENDKSNKGHPRRISYLYYIIKARAYYMLGKYNLAYEHIIKVDFPAYEKHKFDYLNMWSAKVYEGLILAKLGKHKEGIEAIKVGIDKMLLFDKSKFLVSAYKNLSDLYSQINDFENAFITLKKADELQELINKDSSIVF